MSCCSNLTVATIGSRHQCKSTTPYAKPEVLRHKTPISTHNRPPGGLSKTLPCWRRSYTPGPLTADECEQYWQDGYVIKKALLKTDDLRPSLQAIERRVDEVAHKLHAAGLIRDPCSSCDVWTRLTQLEKQYPEAGVLIHKDGRLPPEFAALWSHPTLLQMAQQLLAPVTLVLAHQHIANCVWTLQLPHQHIAYCLWTLQLPQQPLCTHTHSLHSLAVTDSACSVDVAGHPSWNVRAKTPRQSAGDAPWHQDSAYCTPDSWTTLQVTAWIPLLDVTAAHGCMQLLKGGHRTGKTAPHIGANANTWHVYMDEAAAANELGVDFTRHVVTADMQAGDVLLFNNLTPHRSLDNTSDGIRWSLDLRWQHPDLPDGAYGLKRSIRMTHSGNPDYVIPWAGWADVDKNTGAVNNKQHNSNNCAAQLEAAGASTGGTATVASAMTDAPASTEVADSVNTAADESASADAGPSELPLDDSESPLSTVLVGPWLDLWPITHQNKHTKAWLVQKQLHRPPVA